MKKFRCVILTFVIAACAMPALAIAENATLLRADNQSAIKSVESMAYIADTLYVISYDQTIYALDLRGDGAWVEYDYPESDNYIEIAALTTDGSALYALCVEQVYGDYDERIRGASLAQIEFEGDRAEFTNAVELSWDDMVVIDNEYEYSRNVNGAFIQDGKLMFTTYGLTGDFELFVYDLNTGDAQTPKIDRLTGAYPYKPGSVLVSTYSYSQQKLTGAISALDLNTGDLVAIAELALSTNPPIGLAYNRSADTIYYILNGELFALTPGQKPAAVSALPADGMNTQPALTPDGFYIAADYSAIYRRNIDPNARAKKRLAVENTYANSMEEAYYAFTAKHPDVEVIRKNQSQDIITAMLNRSSDMDIYALQVDSPQYKALMERGYMAPLTDALSCAKLVNGMYENLKKPLASEGAVVALPLRVSTHITYINTDVLAAMGLSAADVPETIPEYFELIARLPDILEEHTDYMAFEPHYTESMLRSELFSTLMNSYMIYLNDAEDKRFNTPLMRDTLKAFESIDFTSMGLIEDRQGGMSFGFSYDPSMLLFSTHRAFSAEETSGYFTTGSPLLLKLGEDTPPALPTDMYVAFVNPYSENMELALEYMDFIAEHTDLLTLIHLSPENNRPVRIDSYEERLNDIQEELDSRRALMEKANDEEKAVYSEGVKSFEAYLQEFMDVSGWLASENSIAYYKEHSHMLAVNTNIGLMGDNESALSNDLAQYLAGEIDGQTMLNNIDKKLTMMLLEGN